MSSIHDAPASMPGDLNQLEKDLKDAVTVAKAASPADAKPADDGSASQAPPDKFAGKSREEILDMYRNLQSDYGRMANDLGTQRKLTDRLLDLKRSEDLARASRAKPAVQVKSDELLENPTQAIEKIVESRLSETTQQLTGRLSELESRLAQERFLAKHPDYNEYPENPDFLQWVRESTMRQRVAALAAQGDPTAADELLSEYKLVKQHRPKPDDARAAARSATLESGSSAAASEGRRGKVYRRADLIRLKIEKPNVYSDPSFQDEIMRAYAEGRVK